MSPRLLTETKGVSVYQTEMMETPPEPVCATDPKA